MPSGSDEKRPRKFTLVSHSADGVFFERHEEITHIASHIDAEESVHSESVHPSCANNHRCERGPLNRLRRCRNRIEIHSAEPEIHRASVEGSTERYVDTPTGRPQTGKTTERIPRGGSAVQFKRRERGFPCLGVHRRYRHRCTYRERNGEYHPGPDHRRQSGSFDHGWNCKA